MVKIRSIQIRLTRQQHEKIRNDSKAKGFSTISAYLRYLSLHQDEFIAQKITEIHNAVTGRLNDKNTKDKKTRQEHKRHNKNKNEQLQHSLQ